MISEGCKDVIRIINKFILMGQKKTQGLVVLLYQSTIVICNVYLTNHQFSLMNHTSSNNPQIQKLLEKCHKLLANKEIVLCWIH